MDGGVDGARHARKRPVNPGVIEVLSAALVGKQALWVQLAKQLGTSLRPLTGLYSCLLAHTRVFRPALHGVIIIGTCDFTLRGEFTFEHNFSLPSREYPLAGGVFVE